jgi:hypothetical protein
MSLFGYFVVGRTQRPIGELACVQDVCRDIVDGISPGTLGASRSDGDWQYLQIVDGAGLDAADIVAETGEPALVVYVIESAIGLVSAGTADGVTWRRCLNPADAVRAFDIAPEEAGTPIETAALAVAWASAAGRTADADAVTAAVERYVGPFGEGVDAFVTALGFRFR